MTRLACGGALAIVAIVASSPGPSTTLPAGAAPAADVANGAGAPAGTARVSPVATSQAAAPSGLDLLYDDRIPLSPRGEPVVTTGVVSGEKQVSLRARAPVDLDFWDAGVEKRATVREGEVIDIAVRRSTPAARQYYVDLEGTRFGDSAQLERALLGWRQRGYEKVRVMEEGVVLGLRGRVLDNREYRIVVDAANHLEAQRQADEVFGRFGTRAEVKARLAERPWGELTVRAGKAPLGVATSYVRVMPPAGGVLQVDQVEFGQGYAWHGRENRSYHGELYVVVDPDGALAVVNVLGVEQLLEGIVPAELYASSPVEALKAQAVAARNHLLSKLGRRHHDDPFRICSEQHCQVYAGTSREDPRSTAAVRATAGLALFFDGRLVECAYSASCGGHTEDNDAVWGNDPDPALRGRPDFDVEEHPELAAFAGALSPALMPSWLALEPKTFCAAGAAGRAERIRWSRTFSAAELNRLVASQYSSVGQVRDLVVDERGSGGRVVVLRLVGTLGSTMVVHELSIRRLFNNLNSGAFVIEIGRDGAGALTAATFRGAGWGHGVGMCQLGAIGRAAAGQSFEQILTHYYNGATVERLY